MNGSVATLSGLVQFPFEAEKDELAQDEIEESENDEHTEADRWKGCRFVSRLSLIRSHSFAGLSLSMMLSILGAGVFGGVTMRWKDGSGASNASLVMVGCSIGLDNSETGSDISMVGITASASRS